MIYKRKELNEIIAHAMDLFTVFDGPPRAYFELPLPVTGQVHELSCRFCVFGDELDEIMWPLNTAVVDGSPFVLSRG